MKILSLDGGGLKGIYTIEVLIKIEKEFNIDFAQYFDIIIGTSTGSIIATLLSFGKKPKEILDIYLKYSDKIFDDNYNKKLTRGLFSSLYNKEILNQIVRDELKDYTSKDLKTNLIIPSFNLTKSEIFIYKSYEKNEISLEDAIVASSSAPIFFDPHDINDDLYVDGSIYSNNPSLIAISESFRLGETNLDNIKILSIGTGYMKNEYNKESISNKKILEKLHLNSFLYDALIRTFKIEEEKSGLISISKPLLLASVDSSSQLSDYFIKTILKDENYIRINDHSQELKINKIPDNLVKKVDLSFEKKYNKDLKIFFNNKEKTYLKKILLRLSKKLYEMSNK